MVITPLCMQASIFGARPKPGQTGRVAAVRASSVKKSPEEDISWHQLTRLVPEKGP